MKNKPTLQKDKEEKIKRFIVLGLGSNYPKIREQTGTIKVDLWGVEYFNNHPLKNTFNTKKQAYNKIIEELNEEVEGAKARLASAKLKIKLFKSEFKIKGNK